MTGTEQYLRINIGGMDYLLPSSVSLAIEQRDSLLVNDDAASHVTAWRLVKTGRWPAYCLDGNLELLRRHNWQRAVFVNASPYPLGLIADDIQLLPAADVRVEPFTPLGSPPTSSGHVFSGAWVQGSKLTLAFQPPGLVAYLRTLGE